jgi:hypothetical protein
MQEEKLKQGYRHTTSQKPIKITSDPTISKYNPDLKPAQVHKSKSSLINQ